MLALQPLVSGVALGFWRGKEKVKGRQEGYIREGDSTEEGRGPRVDGGKERRKEGDGWYHHQKGISFSSQHLLHFQKKTDKP